MRSLLVALALAALVFAGWMGLAGCQPSENLPFAAEIDEPLYRRGTQLLRGGRAPEALEAFLKVIERRGGDAPESHLECGILYLQHIKDPVAAIYHFRNYLALRPNSPQAARTKELIDTAMKEFARTLPATPFEGQIERLDLRETVARLQKENYQLKEQIAQLRGLPVSMRPQVAAAADAEPESATELSDEPSAAEPEVAPAIPVAGARPASPRLAEATAAVAPAPASPPSAPSGRVHTVQKGDSLFGISRRYYGSGSKVPEIVAANRDVLQDRNTPLKIGMQLRLP